LNSNDRIAAAIVARHMSTGEIRTAAFGDEQESQSPSSLDPSSAQVGQRNIPDGHEFSPKALKPLAKMLWAMSISLGHALTAYRQFTRLKSSMVSPDGMLGGRGYVMSVKDVRNKLQEACEALSAVSDTIHDEVHAPHWKPKLSDVGANDAEDIQRFIDEAEKNLENPEEESDQEMGELESDNDDSTPNDVTKAQWDESEGDGASRIPNGGSQGVVNRADPANQKLKQASVKALDSEWRKLIREAMKTGTSSIPVETMPGGPRVDTLDRGSQTGPYGSYNEDEPRVEDNWGETDGVGNDYLYHSEWENNFSHSAGKLPVGQSSIPDYYNSDYDTKTEARDFGLGYGAKGQGTEGYGLQNPSNSNGVFGPSSGMPNDPGGKTKGDSRDSTPFREDSHYTVEASNEDITTLIGEDLVRLASTNLPNDGEAPVARSDYYPGQKGNIISEAKLPGTQLPAKDTPTKPRPAHLFEHEFASAELPGDDTDSSYDFDKDAPNVGYRFERQDNPYMKFDDSTRNYRPDYSYGNPDGSELRPKTGTI